MDKPTTEKSYADVVVLEDKIREAIKHEPDPNLVLNALCVIIGKMIFMAKRDGNDQAQDQIFAHIGKIAADCFDNRVGKPN